MDEKKPNLGEDTVEPTPENDKPQPKDDKKADKKSDKKAAKKEVKESERTETKGSGSQKPTPKSRAGLLIFMAALSALLVVAWFVNAEDSGKTSWTEFVSHVEMGKVAKMKIGLSYMEVEAIKGFTPQTYQVDFPGGRYISAHAETLRVAIEKCTTQNSLPLAPIVSGGRADGAMTGFLMNILFFAVVITVFYFVFFRRMGGGGGVMSFGKSRANLVPKGKTGKTFKDVAGIDECRDDVQEVVDFLKNPLKYEGLGGRIPRGVLMVGPPGTGKTLLAKAIAGEADVPFYIISGSDFVEMFVGVGASRVRDLFQQAKENSPCIIFIDEIDAVARRRSGGTSGGGNDEREQTLNAILVEMDGFESRDKVIVIAATNRVDVLDPALTRPGRFDRHVHVDAPDINGREAILAVHGAKIKLDVDVNLSILARGTPGFTGADLENMMNEGALHAARHDKFSVAMIDLEYARDRVAFGREKTGRGKAIPDSDKRETAYHEAGHAVIQQFLEECDDLHKVSIIPRGQALGLTMSLPSKDMFSYTRKRILGDMCVLYGGRIAEEKFCNDVSTGASNDIERATALARNMVYEWGMSEKMGPIKYTEDRAGFGGSEKVITVTGATRQALDDEMRAFIDAQYQRAEKIIDDHGDAIHAITDALMEHETISAAQVQILMDGGTIPPRTPVSVPVEVAEPTTDAEEPKDQDTKTDIEQK